MDVVVSGGSSTDVSSKNALVEDTLNKIIDYHFEDLGGIDNKVVGTEYKILCLGKECSLTFQKKDSNEIKYEVISSVEKNNYDIVISSNTIVIDYENYDKNGDNLAKYQYGKDQITVFSDGKITWVANRTVVSRNESTESVMTFSNYEGFIAYTKSDN